LATPRRKPAPQNGVAAGAGCRVQRTILATLPAARQTMMAGGDCCRGCETLRPAQAPGYQLQAGRTQVKADSLEPAWSEVRPRARELARGAGARCVGTGAGASPGGRLLQVCQPSCEALGPRATGVRHARPRCQPVGESGRVTPARAHRGVRRGRVRAAHCPEQSVERNRQSVPAGGRRSGRDISLERPRWHRRLSRGRWRAACWDGRRPGGWRGGEIDTCACVWGVAVGVGGATRQLFNFTAAEVPPNPFTPHGLGKPVSVPLRALPPTLSSRQTRVDERRGNAERLRRSRRPASERGVARSDARARDVSQGAVATATLHCSVLNAGAAPRHCTSLPRPATPRPAKIAFPTFSQCHIMALPSCTWHRRGHPSPPNRSTLYLTGMCPVAINSRWQSRTPPARPAHPPPLPTSASAALSSLSPSTPRRPEQTGSRWGRSRCSARRRR
jgi:hypothetical protein